jgi:hypothetical protein
VGWNQLQVVGVHAQDSKDSPELREVAVNHTLKIRHPTKSPILNIFGLEQIHPSQHINRRHHLAIRENGRDRSLDAGKERIALEVADGDPGRGTARLLRLALGVHAGPMGRSSSTFFADVGRDHARLASVFCQQHFLYFLPDPQGQGALGAAAATGNGRDVRSVEGSVLERSDSTLSLNMW